MKFSKGQKVIILTAERKPAGYATIINYNIEFNKYRASFKYPNSIEEEEIEAPEERIVEATNPATTISALRGGNF